MDYLERNFINHEERRENIEELIGFASNFDDLGRFLEEVALAQPLDYATATTDKKQLTTDNRMSGVRCQMSDVFLSTIHLSKGLEFDRVFVAGASEGLLPHAMSMDNEYQLEEERRLMYVAMTRAKKELHISFYDMPSRFIGEIPEGLAEYSNFADGESKTACADFENYISLD